jgi:hypothetical protein
MLMEHAAMQARRTTRMLLLATKGIGNRASFVRRT